MTWFKVDDSLAFHAKIVAAGNPAMGLWVRAGSWSAQQLTDGHIPDHMIAALGNKAQAGTLVQVGLWQREPDGYRFWQWTERNPTAAEVRQDQADRYEVKARAGRAGGIASGIARRKHNGSTCFDAASTNAKQNEAPSRPVPSRGSFPDLREDVDVDVSRVNDPAVIRATLEAVTAEWRAS